MKRAFVRKALQFVVGIGLAVFLLWWGLPRIAHTTWTAPDVFNPIVSVPLNASGPPNAWW